MHTDDWVKLSLEERCEHLRHVLMVHEILIKALIAATGIRLAGDDDVAHASHATLERQADGHRYQHGQQCQRRHQQPFPFPGQGARQPDDGERHGQRQQESREGRHRG
jgi:hypothetical protein